jgi:virginiamycin B lyase
MRLTRTALLLTPTVAALWAGALPASGAPLREVRSFPIPGIPIPGSIAAGADGDIWVSGDELVARLSTAGETAGEVTTLNTTHPLGQMVAGSDGNIWFDLNGGSSTILGRITPLGEISEFNEAATYGPRRLTLGPDGDVWYTAGLPGLKIVSKEGEPSSIGRIAPSGQVTEFQVGLASKAILDQIVTGPDGNLWFVNQAESHFAIGRITPTGEIKEFPIADKPWLRPSGLAAGVNGNVYFGASGENPITTEEENIIGEITPAGETKVAALLRNSEVLELATGPEGSVWFTGLHTEPLKPNVIGRLTPAGVLEEDTASFGTETQANLITPGPDGSMWFITSSKTSREVHSIGTSAPAASQTPPTVTGADQVGATLTCDGATWSTWADQQPSTSLHGFDGYTWLLDGRPIAGQSAPSLLVGSADLGHQISCTETATYQLLNLTASAASAPVSIGPSVGSPPAPPSPSVLELPHQTDKVSAKGVLHISLDCSGAPCSGTVKLIEKTKVTTGRGKHRKTKTVSVTLATGAFSSVALGVDEISLKLTHRGLGLLQSHGYRLGASASISYTSSATTKASITGAVKLAGTKPKPRHRSA